MDERNHWLPFLSFACAILMALVGMGSHGRHFVPAWRFQAFPAKSVPAAEETPMAQFFLQRLGGIDMSRHREPVSRSIA